MYVALGRPLFLLLAVFHLTCSWLSLAIRVRFSCSACQRVWLAALEGYGSLVIRGAWIYMHIFARVRIQCRLT